SSRFRVRAVAALTEYQTSRILGGIAHIRSGVSANPDLKRFSFLRLRRNGLSTMELSHALVPPPGPERTRRDRRGLRRAARRVPGGRARLGRHAGRYVGDALARLALVAVPGRDA